MDTLTDDLNTIASENDSIEEALINKVVIDVEIDELTRKENKNRSLVQENKKIPVKMLKKNIKIEK